MSAEVPPTSSVITFSKPAWRPIQMPPTTPATGPDIEQVHGALDRALRGGDAAGRGHQVQAGAHAQARAARPRAGARTRPRAGRRTRSARPWRSARTRGTAAAPPRRPTGTRPGTPRARSPRRAPRARGSGTRTGSRRRRTRRRASRRRLTCSRARSSSSGTRIVAVGGDPLRHRQPVAAARERERLPGQVLVVREVERLLVARDVEDVAVALGRDHARRGRRCARSRCWWRSWCRGRPGRGPPGVTPDLRRSARWMPSTVPIEGSSGVVGSLWISILPLSSSTKMRSVKVPPTSTPRRLIYRSNVARVRVRSRGDQDLPEEFSRRSMASIAAFVSSSGKVAATSGLICPRAPSLSTRLELLA